MLLLYRIIGDTATLLPKLDQKHAEIRFGIRDRTFACGQTFSVLDGSFFFLPHP
jgi:hypothetical protein